MYIHVPWCKRRCPYCAFYVEVDRQTDWSGFITQLIHEKNARRPEYHGPMKTMFFGGGTPSRMPAALFKRLVSSLTEPSIAEIGIEANPEDVQSKQLEHWLDSGVNRISLGIQTFNQEYAHLLNRACTVSRAREIIDSVRESGVRSWSVDLMFALPNQSLDDLKKEVDNLLQCEPPHVSLYGLTYEPGTPFERARKNGKLSPVDDEIWRAMYEYIVATLRSAGLQRYEVSNFSRPGHESIHNQLYWSDMPYMGIGPSAHGYTSSGARTANPANVQTWLQLGQFDGYRETPTKEQAALDMLVSGLRSRNGVSLGRMAEKTGFTIDVSPLHSWFQKGLIRLADDHLMVMDDGFPLTDALSRQLVHHLVPR